jgi:hypothetical protein
MPCPLNEHTGLETITRTKFIYLYVVGYLMKVSIAQIL